MKKPHQPSLAIFSLWPFEWLPPWSHHTTGLSSQPVYFLQ